MVIFVAYEGFELIANSAEDVCDPGRTLPRALYLSVGIVIATYVLVAVVTVGALSFPAARAASDHVLATAARPALGGVGFVLVAVAALLSTTSAINATLYGTARVSWTIARSGELPEFLDSEGVEPPDRGATGHDRADPGRRERVRPHEDRPHGERGIPDHLHCSERCRRPARLANQSTRAIALGAAAACTAALVALLLEEGVRSTGGVVIVAGLVGGSFFLEVVYRACTHRPLPTHLATLANPGIGTPDHGEDE